MTREEIGVLIAKLEKESGRNPKSYTARVGIWAMTGYAYLLVVLLVMTAVTLLMVALTIIAPKAIKLTITVGVISGGLCLAIIKAMFVRMTPPQGYRLRREQAPELFKEVDALARRLGCPPFEEVLVDGDFNASVVQVPRLGLLGWHRSYLTLGLPLLQALPADEFRAVLAHEFAHLSGNHSRFSGWLYRVRRSWERVFEELGRQGSGGGWALGPFLNWYWPRFNARAFVLSRVNEYEADRCAADYQGASIAGSALMRVEVMSRHCDQGFWSGIHKRAAVEPLPPEDIYHQWRAAMKSGPAVEDSTKWIQQAFNVETGNTDTHPCLRDRLRALGALPEGVEQGQLPARLVPSAGPTAAEHFLGAEEKVIADTLGLEWRKNVEPVWTTRFKEAQEATQKLKELEKAEAESRELTVDQLWEKAQALLELSDDREALPWVSRVLERQPDHAAANFIRGRVALKEDQVEGVTFIERAAAADAMLVPAACEILYGHYQRTGQKEKLKEIESRIDSHREMMELAQAERSDATTSDLFLSHGLEPSVQSHIREVVAVEKDVKSVDVARKQVKHLPHIPMYVVAIALGVPWWKPRSSEANQKLALRLVEKLTLPGQFLVVVCTDDAKKLGKKIAEVPGVRVYDRPA